jgi:hypothetical protein
MEGISEVPGKRKKTRPPRGAARRVGSSRTFLCGTPFQAGLAFSGGVIPTRLQPLHDWPISTIRGVDGSLSKRRHNPSGRI